MELIKDLVELLVLILKHFSFDFEFIDSSVLDGLFYFGVLLFKVLVFVFGFTDHLLEVSDDHVLFISIFVLARIQLHPALGFINIFSRRFQVPVHFILLLLKNRNPCSQSCIFFVYFVESLLQLQRFGVQSLFVLVYFFRHDPSKIIRCKLWFHYFNLFPVHIP